MIRPSRRAIVAVGVAVAALALGGCGKRGPIVAPERRLPMPPDSMRAAVEERVIVVS